jgi:hypothetical protein
LDIIELIEDCSFSFACICSSTTLNSHLKLWIGRYIITRWPYTIWDRGLVYHQLILYYSYGFYTKLGVDAERAYIGSPSIKVGCIKNYVIELKLT